MTAPDAAFAPIAAAGLRLRPPGPEDAPHLAAISADRRVTRFLSALEGLEDEDRARAAIARASADMAAGRAYRFVAMQGDGDTAIGGGSIIREPDGGAEIAYWVLPENWGQGLGTALARALAALSVHGIGATRAWAGAHADNAASGRVLAKSGLDFEGRRNVTWRGAQHPFDIYAATRDRPADLAHALATPVIHVAAACLIDAEDRILVARRPPGKSMAGLWEFPGGKVEPGETPAQAAARELTEELGVTVPVAALTPVAIASHRYPRFHLLMPLLAARDWADTPTPREGQEIAWVSLDELRRLEMPPADAPLIDALTALLVGPLA